MPDLHLEKFQLQEDGTWLNQRGGSFQYNYDESGLILSVRDLNGKTYVKNTYDGDSRVTRQEMINGGIRRLRESKKLTQEQFAEKINMSVQGYRNLEHNKYQTTAETVDKVCDVFNISPVELLLPEPQKDLVKIIELINNKLSTCSIDKLIRINNMIDLM